MNIARCRHGTSLQSLLSNCTRLVLHRPVQEARDAKLHKTIVVESEKGKVLETLV